MLIDQYVFGDSPIHRAPPGVKLLALVAFCSLNFIFPGWTSLAISSTILIAGYWLSGVGARCALECMRPALWILGVVFIAQLVLDGVESASFVVARFCLLILGASLVTMTTKTSEFVEGILAGLRHAPSWFPSDQIALAFSLVLRFIPLVRVTLEEVRMAQRARGLDRDIKAIIVPLVVRTLKTGDQIAEAIQARTPL